MICQYCSKEFEEREIEEHHLHPRFMDNKKGVGKKIYLCKKCHNILHLKIPVIIWKFISEDKKIDCMQEVMKFTLNKLKEDV